MDTDLATNKLDLHSTTTQDLACSFLLLLQMHLGVKEVIERLGLAYGPDFLQAYREKFFPGVETEKIPFLPVSENSAACFKDLQPCIVAFRAQLKRHIKFPIFHTAKGYIGMGPPGVEADDVVCVLNWCDYVVVLRKVDDHYFHVGTCFVLGLSGGEPVDMVRKGNLTIEELHIH